jgi:plasmid stabilization system protein ParE
MMKREGIPFDGFGSVLEMLHRADANFREKIINNLRRKDPELARRLENGLRHTAASFQETPMGDSRATLERSQRAAFTRSYGQ